jgi:hypothetical protein
VALVALSVRVSGAAASGSPVERFCVQAIWVASWMPLT